MFCLLVDPIGWIEIGGEAFAPGSFLLKHEVGRHRAGGLLFLALLNFYGTCL